MIGIVHKYKNKIKIVDNKPTHALCKSKREDAWGTGLINKFNSIDDQIIAISIANKSPKNWVLDFIDFLSSWLTCKILDLEYQSGTEKSLNVI